MTFRFVLAVVLAIAAIVFAVVGNRKVTDDSSGAAKTYPLPFRTVAVYLFGAALVFGLWSCVRIVAPGEVGVPVTFGKVGSPISSGIKFVNPFASVNKLSVQTENYTMSGISDEGAKNGNDAVDALGSDGGSAAVESTVLFHLDEQDAANVYRNVGTSYVDKILRPVSRACIRDQFGKGPMVEEATGGRGTVAAAITTCLEHGLEGRGLILESFQLRDVRLDPKLQESVTNKVNAQQDSEKQAFVLSSTQQQAEIARVDAQGKADAQQIIACGGVTIPDEKGGTKVVPRTGGDCLNTLTPAYLQYLYIQALTTVANSPNNSTVIIPFDQNLTPLLNLNDAPR